MVDQTIDIITENAAFYQQKMEAMQSFFKRLEAWWQVGWLCRGWPR
jgi:hypothetical protein